MHSPLKWHFTGAHHGKLKTAARIWSKEWSKWYRNLIRVKKIDYSFCSWNRLMNWQKLLELQKSKAEKVLAMKYVYGHWPVSNWYTQISLVTSNCFLSMQKICSLCKLTLKTILSIKNVQRTLSKVLEYVDTCDWMEQLLVSDKMMNVFLKNSIWNRTNWIQSNHAMNLAQQSIEMTHFSIKLVSIETIC